MLVNGFTDGRMTTSVAHQSLIDCEALLGARASPAGSHPAAALPHLQVPMSAVLLQIYMHSQAYFALEERNPVSLTRVPLRGHIHCSLFIGSIKENVSS